MKNCGFTLVELVVIIAIIGILLAIAHLNFAEMQRKENAKSDLTHIIADIRMAQMSCITQGRIGVMTLGGKIFKTLLYSNSVSDIVPAVSLNQAGMPSMPQPATPAPVPGNPAPEIPLMEFVTPLKTATQGYITFYIDSKGMPYHTDPDDSTKISREPVALCFSGSALVMHGNQIKEGKLPEGKDCKPEEVTF